MRLPCLLLSSVVEDVLQILAHAYFVSQLAMCQRFVMMRWLAASLYLQLTSLMQTHIYPNLLHSLQDQEDITEKERIIIFSVLMYPSKTFENLKEMCHQITVTRSRNWENKVYKLIRPMEGLISGGKTLRVLMKKIFA